MNLFLYLHHRLQDLLHDLPCLFIFSETQKGGRLLDPAFEKYSAMGKDPDVIAFAQQTLPTLKAPLAAIIAIANKLNDKSN